MQINIFPLFRIFRVDCGLGFFPDSSVGNSMLPRWELGKECRIVQFRGFFRFRVTRIFLYTLPDLYTLPAFVYAIDPNHACIFKFYHIFNPSWSVYINLNPSTRNSTAIVSFSTALNKFKRAVLSGSVGLD